VRQANRRDAVFLFQIPAHHGLRRILLPVRKPGAAVRSKKQDNE
jgi:hypothetical protein